MHTSTSLPIEDGSRGQFYDILRSVVLVHKTNNVSRFLVCCISHTATLFSHRTSEFSHTIKPSSCTAWLDISLKFSHLLQAAVNNISCSNQMQTYSYKSGLLLPKNGLLLGPNNTASSPFVFANSSNAISRCSYVLLVFSSWAWLSFSAASLAPAARFEERRPPILSSFPQLWMYLSTFGLRPL